MNSKQCEAGWSCQDFSSRELRAYYMEKIRLDDHVFSSYLLSTLSYGIETGKNRQ